MDYSGEDFHKHTKGSSMVSQGGASILITMDENNITINMECPDDGSIANLTNSFSSLQNVQSLENTLDSRSHIELETVEEHDKDHEEGNIIIYYFIIIIYIFIFSLQNKTQ